TSTFVSRNSGADIQVGPFPGSLADPEPELLKAALQGLAFPPLPPSCSLVSRKLLQILANHASQGRIPLDSDLPHLLDEIVVDRESDIHIPIIRETHNSCKLAARLGDTRQGHGPRETWPPVTGPLFLKIYARLTETHWARGVRGIQAEVHRCGKRI